MKFFIAGLITIMAACATHRGVLKKPDAAAVIGDFFNAIEKKDKEETLALLFEASVIHTEVKKLIEDDDWDDLQNIFTDMVRIDHITANEYNNYKAADVLFTLKTKGLLEDEREENTLARRDIQEQYIFKLLYDNRQNLWVIYDHAPPEGKNIRLEFD